MPERHLPVAPSLRRLKREAKQLHRAIRTRDPAAVADLRNYHPEPISPAAVKLADAQLVLARSYRIPSWPRLVLACRMTSAIRRDDVDTVRELVLKYPHLLHEDARGVKGNWGPPLSYAANLGRDNIITMLRDLGAADLQFAFDRACLQGQLQTARLLYDFGARPVKDSIMGPAETLNAHGMELLLEMGAAISDGSGDRLAPVAMVLETYARNPEGKHRCLDVLARNGIDLPDTPTMAVHLGRIDLLEELLARDASLLSRTFSHEEIYPAVLGCHADHSLALHGTPVAGATLMHLCVDHDELAIARWLLERGADPDARAEVDGDGFGGHTPLFGCVVSQPYRNGRTQDTFARLLLDAGANPNARASLRKRLRFVADETMHEYRDVTPLSWGTQFHDQDWVSQAVMKLIADRGGRA
jgi:hypothetical protein